jgi:hypothetical protein
LGVLTQEYGEIWREETACSFFIQNSWSCHMRITRMYPSSCSHSHIDWREQRAGRWLLGDLQ